MSSITRQVGLHKIKYAYHILDTEYPELKDGKVVFEMGYITPNTIGVHYIDIKNGERQVLYEVFNGKEEEVKRKFEVSLLFNYRFGKKIF
jgi:hypothetical protein